MRIVEVDDAADPRVDEYTRLTDSQLRMVREPAEGLFLAEGEKVILRALAAGFAPRSVLLERKWLPGLEDAFSKYDINVYLADELVLKAVVGYRLHRGALAAFTRRRQPSVEEVLAGASFVVVLEDLVDHTNVGLIFRSAAALGAGAILVSPQCADPLYRRSVKVSMGAVFTVPWTRAQPWPDLLTRLGDMGYARLALTPGPDSVSLRDVGVRPDQRVALLVGTEGAGLSSIALTSVDQRVRIPMANGMDSLNAAAAAAIACFVLGSA